MRGATERATQERVLEGQTTALSLLNRIRAFNKLSDRVYFGMGAVSGLQLLLLGLFITYQVIARKLGWVKAPGTDNMSGYILAMAATWALSYTLRTGAHVRIDAVLPFMPRPVRAVADWAALAALGFFASVTAWKLWVTILKLYENGTLSNDYPLTPMWIPRVVAALGFSLLGFTSIQMMLSTLAEAFLPRLHQLMGGTASYLMVPKAAGGADGPHQASPPP